MKNQLIRIVAISSCVLSLSPLALAASTTGTDTATVVRVVDGDTIQVKLSTGKLDKVRIIGIDTPETVDPRKEVQCYGKEASAKMKVLLNRKKVTLEMNPAEDKDKYGRLLRYVSIKGKDIGAQMIKDGYAFSYKSYPHPRLDQYNELEKSASESKTGLWGATCEYSKPISKSSSSTATSKQSSSKSSVSSVSSSCTIKGNISASKEKIYHVEGCGTYSATQIDVSAGERWFCSESEAKAAGWRKALNCN
jgi:micrococcal nuclease